MKRTGKVITYLVVLAMVTSLFAGLGFADKKVSANVNKTFTVLEIVPNTSMRQFGYLIAGQEPIDIKAVNTAKVGSGDSSFRTYINNSGIGTIEASGNYVSNDVFRTQVLPAKTSLNENIDWTINYNFKTFSDLSDADINSADLIVITDSVPSQLQVSGVTVSSFNSLSNSDISWSKVYKVFKKIAGVDGATPIPYLIDYKVYDNISKSNIASKYFYDTPGLQDDYPRDESNSIPYKENVQGSTKNIFKLYLMLTAMNPSTFYGIYIRERGDGYGVDPVNGKILGYDLLKDTIGDPFTYKGYDGWGTEMLKPYFISSGNISSTMAKIGFTDPNLCLAIIDQASSNEWYTAVTGYKKWAALEAGIVVNGSDGGYVGNYSDIKSSFSSLVSRYCFGGRSLVDSREYRFLIVTPGNIDANVNRSLVANVVEYTRNNGNKGLVGGVKVDCMSMYQFVSLSSGLDETYDCIYFAGDGTKYASAGSTASVNGQFQLFESGVTTTVLAGNDLTHLKYTELDRFVNTKHRPVIISKQLKDSSVDTSTYMYSFLHGLDYTKSYIFEDTSSNGLGVNYGSVFSAIQGKGFSLTLINTPNEYFSNVNLDFKQQNDNDSYYATAVTDPNFKAYINSKGKEDYRKLDFTFRIEGNTGSSFTAKLYLDMNSDGIYDEDAGSYVLKDGYYVLEGGEKFWTKSSCSENTDYTVKIDVLPDGYVGPVAWKFSVTDGTYVYSKCGYSACRSTDDSGDPHRVNVIQVYPTFTNDAGSGGVYKQIIGSSQTGYFQLSVPSLILPTDYEIGLADPSGNVKSMQINDSLSTIDDLFVNKLYVDQAGTQDHFNSSAGVGAEFKSVPTSAAVSNSGVGRVMIKNAGAFYYFAQKQKDYDIHATRFSVYDFNQKVAAGKIYYDKDNTKKLVYKESTTATPVYFDVLMLGFGSSMDYMTPAAVKVITDYVDADQPVLMGNGTVSFSERNTLGQALRARIGQDRYNVTSNNGSNPGSSVYGLPYQKNTTTVYGNGTKYYLQGYNKGFTTGPDDNGNNPVNGMKLNENVLTNYPYYIPEKFKLTSGCIQPYQLDLEDEQIVVSFVKQQDNVTEWGNGRSDYFLYKKGNITFCSVGKTSPNYSRNQVGGVMTHPECCLVFNSLVAASDSRTGGGNDNAYVTCTDPDSSSVDIVGVDPLDPTKQVHTYKDYVYVDYDATQDNMTGDTAPMGNTSIVGTAPDGTSYGYTARRVPYEATVSTNADLKICKHDTDIKIDIKVYKVNDDDSLTEAPKNASGNYIITNGDTYMIDVPLNDSFYTDKGISGCGLTGRDSFNVDIVVTTDNDPEKVEKNELNVVRRGMFLIN